jgi:MoaA/NifB/PqqE/SkfB family radical SAM enzyme
VRRAARAVLPESFVDGTKDTIIKRLYKKSMISRESAFHSAMRRTFTSKGPTLYHLDVHITDHCNLNCKGCENFSSISPKRFADLHEFDRDFGRMAELFDSIEQIYLMGGEPLLHPQVAEFVRVARKHFPKTRLNLLTNAILVTKMSEEFWVAMRESDCVLLCDLYPIGIPVEEIESLGASHGVTVEWMKPTSEFFKIPVDLQGSCDPVRSHDACRGLTNCAIVRDGRLFPCARAAYSDHLAGRFQLEGIDATDADSVSLADAKNGDEVIDFLMKPVPWCAHCDFDALETYEWGRTERDVGEWLTPGDAERVRR